MAGFESRIALVAALVAGAAALSACAPLVVAGVAAAGTTAVVTDRRTAGTQVDDQSIQLRVSSELSTALGKQPVHINVNSFNRRVLLTGEVPDEQAKTQAGEVAARSRDVRMVVNELAIAPPSSIGDRTNDTGLTTKVRASFVNTKEVAFNSIEIVTERRTVYLLGIVTQREADIAALVASKVSGVQQVVKVFEIVEPSAITPPPAGSPAPPK
ncbi:MAG TPA: BON domain-containing protein [Pseudomonadales bacterium]